MNAVNHHEHREPSRSKNAILLAIFSTAGIFIVEIVGGIWTNSLALLSDAAHVFMDLVSFVLSYSAMLLAARPISDTRTFGWHRVEVFAAVINAGTVLLIAVLIFVHACRRIAAPVEILGPEMLAIASIGLFVNLFVIWKMHPHVGEDVNVRSAFLHAFGDAAASVAVVGGGIVVMLTGAHIVDPIAAIVVALIILVSAYGIMRDSFHILLEGAPKGLERNLIVQAIEEIAGSESVKDLHVWNLCSHICALSVHLIVPDRMMAEQRTILEKINSGLEKRFNIIHTTIQIQSDNWQNKNN